MDACIFQIVHEATKQVGEAQATRSNEHKTSAWMSMSTGTLPDVFSDFYVDGRINSKANSEFADAVNFISILILFTISSEWDISNKRRSARAHGLESIRVSWPTKASIYIIKIREIITL